MGLEFGIRDHIQAIELLQNITAVNKKDLVLDSEDKVALRVMNLIPYVVKSLTIHVEWREFQEIRQFIKLQICEAAFKYILIIFKIKKVEKNLFLN